jgi:hypothetical protein
MNTKTAKKQTAPAKSKWVSAVTSGDDTDDYIICKELSTKYASYVYYRHQEESSK